MTSSSFNLSSDPSLSQRQSTVPAQNWHQASLAIEAAYSRITQVRQNLTRLSSTMPHALSSSESHNDLDPGYDALLLSSGESREPPTGNGIVMHLETEFSSNTHGNTEDETVAIDNGGPSSRSVTVPNVLPPTRRESFSSSSLTTRGRRVMMRDSAISLRRNAERFAYQLDDSVHSLEAGTPVDLHHSNALFPESRRGMRSGNYVDTITPLPHRTVPSDMSPSAIAFAEQRRRSFRASFQARLESTQAPSRSPVIASQRSEMLDTYTWRAREPSALEELETYSAWREHDFPLWPSSNGRVSSSTIPTEGGRASREPARTSQQHSNSESRQANVPSRRADPPRRGWARLDSDGIEIPQNEEEELERSRTEYRLRALQRAREDGARSMYADALGGHYHAPYGSVMDAALNIQGPSGRSSSHTTQDEYRPRCPFYVDPLPMPLASMEMKPEKVDDLYVDIVLSKKACFAGR
ncbi:hypothetical protein CVT24_003550 [Panaeolus cyanescens]|uniref:Uncharacterized protein n=1 Tax=Panaeolus cyanescens TaxID=181874 RepID=A0A409Y7G2_9AGAR|nr:hypothetical protein CVT24_003550 [Panaeolus cyanescens]